MRFYISHPQIYNYHVFTLLYQNFWFDLWGEFDYKIQKNQFYFYKISFMVVSSRKLLQNQFTLIRVLQHNRRKYKHIQTFIALLDCLLILLLHFAATIIPRTSTTSIPQMFNTSMHIESLAQILTYFHSLTILIIITGNSLRIFGQSYPIKSEITLKRLQSISTKMVIVSSWAYQSTLVLFYIFIAQNISSSLKLQYSMLSLTLLNIIFSLLYVGIFEGRKIFGICLPPVLLVESLLEEQISGLLIGFICIYCWSHSPSKLHKIICVNLLQLKVIQIIYWLNGESPDLNNSIRITLILIATTAIYLLPTKGKMIGGKSVDKDEAIIEVIKRRNTNKSYKQTLEDKIQVYAFMLSGPYSIQLDSQQDKYAQCLQMKLKTELENDPSNICKLMQSIRLNMLQQPNIILTLSLLERLSLLSQSHPLRTQYTVKVFIYQSISKLGLSSEMGVQQVIDRDKLLSKSEGHIIDFTRKIIAYWEYLLGQTLNQNHILEGLEDIEASQKNIMRMIQYYQSRKVERNSLMVCQFALKCLYPHYQINVPPIDGGSSPKTTKDSSYFVVIEGQRVKHISYRLSKHLEIEHSFKPNAPLGSIFPRYACDFSQLFCNKRQSLFIVPLTNGRGLIQPMKSMIRIVPSFQGRICYILEMQEQPKEVFPYIIINNTQSTLEHISVNFHKCFKYEKLRPNLCLQELFGRWTSFEQQTVKNVSIKISQTFTKAKLQKVSTYLNGGNEYLLLRVSLNRKPRSTTTMDLFIQKSMDSNYFQKHQLFEKQTFFCKIPHPYENKYAQTIVRLKDGTRWRSSHKATAIFVFIIIILILNLILHKATAQINSAKFGGLVLELQEVNEAKSSLLQLYQKDYQLFQMRINNFTFSQIYIGNISMVDELAIQINHLVNKLQYFRFSYHQQIINLPFHLQFRGFEVTGLMMDTNLVDILQSSKELINDNELLFLTNNYHFAEVFESAYNICPIMSQKIKQETKLFLYIIVVSMVILALALIVLYWILKDVIDTSHYIIMLAMNSKKEIIQKKLKNLRQFQHFLQTIEELSLEEEGNTSFKEGLGQFVSLVRKSKKEKSEIRSTMKDIILKEDQLMKSRSIIADKSKDPQQAKILYTFHSKQAMTTHPFLLCIKQSYFAFIFIFIGLYLVRLHVLSQEYSQEKRMVLQYFNQYFESERSLIKLSAQMYQQIMQSHYQIGDRFGRTYSIELRYYNQGILPDFFASFINKERTYVSSDLCLQTSDIFLFNTSLCNSLLGGVLNSGVGVAYALFFEKVQHLVEQIGEEDQHLQEELENIWLMNMLLLQNIKRIREEFRKQISRFMQYKDQLILYSTISEQLPFLAVLLTIFVFGMNRFKQRCELMIKGFKMLPKEYLLNSRLLKFIRKKRIFESVIQI